MDPIEQAIEEAWKLTGLPAMPQQLHGCVEDELDADLLRLLAQWSRKHGIINELTPEECREIAELTEIAPDQYIDSRDLDRDEDWKKDEE